MAEDIDFRMTEHLLVDSGILFGAADLDCIAVQRRNRHVEKVQISRGKVDFTVIADDICLTASEHRDRLNHPRDNPHTAKMPVVGAIRHFRTMVGNCDSREVSSSRTGDHFFQRRISVVGDNGMGMQVSDDAHSFQPLSLL